MKTTALILAGILLACSLTAAAASDGKGGQPGAFRDVKIGARPSALGGAFTAIAEGGIGHLYNPAGLAQSRRYEMSFAYRAMQLDRRLGYVSAAIPAKEEARLAISWLYAGTAALQSRDEQGNVIPGADISHSENLIGIDFAKRFIPQLMLGGRMFYVQNNIANINAYTVGVDVGALVKLDARKTFLASAFPLFQAGLAAENLGANYRWSTGKYWQTRGRERGAAIKETFPINFRLGSALISPERYLLAADIEANTASIIKTHLGGEYTFKKTLSLRAGLDDLHPTFGAGFFKKLDRFGLWIDVAYLTDNVGEGDDVMFSFDLVF